MAQDSRLTVISQAGKEDGIGGRRTGMCKEKQGVWEMRQERREGSAKRSLEPGSLAAPCAICWGAFSRLARTTVSARAVGRMETNQPHPCWMWSMGSHDGWK